VYLQIGDVLVDDVWASRDRIIGSALERLGSMPDVGLEPLEKEVAALEAEIGHLPSFYGHLISTAEAAVELAGNATDLLMVVALRHIVEVELAAATAAVGEADLELALAAERDFARSWRKVLGHLRAGRAAAARRAYELQAALLLEGLAPDMTVGDAVRADPADLVNAHVEQLAALEREVGAKPAEK
jgi:hypothetical protein